MANSDYQNTTNRIKVVLLRTPMVAPKMSHALSICPPLGLAYLGAALQKADFEVTSIDAVGEEPLQKIIFSLFPAQKYLVMLASELL